MEMVIALITGVILGSAVSWKITSKFIRKEMQIRLEESEKRIIEEKNRKETMKIEMENIFKALAGEVLKGNTHEFLTLAGEKFKSLSEVADQKLDEKKKLIDQNLKDMDETLKGLSRETLKISQNLHQSQSETEKLRSTTDDLRMVLSSSQQRGKWGERMVEDILRFIGMQENKSYRKQSTVKSGERPDFTFILPKGQELNMDVKFPWDNYNLYVTSEDEKIKEHDKKAFFRDLKNHVKAIAKREYIDPASGTLNYVLMFIPNESIYGFINTEAKEGIVDFALGKNVLLCSPLTLYAVLSLIHQAATNFSIEQQAKEIMALLQQFNTQWSKYTISMEKMGKRIDDAKKEFDHLTTTRSNQLEKPLKKIDELTFTIPKVLQQK